MFIHDAENGFKSRQQEYTKKTQNKPKTESGWETRTLNLHSAPGVFQKASMKFIPKKPPIDSLNKADGMSGELTV